jgi:NAD(P)-dependent dehydrogenase (short-subunit alcohol dehydrogenase family)
VVEGKAVPGRVKEKVALVTGAGSGIGRATAILLAQEGATVVVSDINLNAAEKVVGEIRQNSGTGEAASLDVADEASWAAILDMILSRRQRLDVLVNNAGVSFAKPVAEMTLDEWRRVLSVNLDGVFLGTKHAIGAMQSGSGGSIINVASVSGMNAYPQAGAYGASKAAVRLFSRVAAIECADAKAGIRVDLVTPSGVKTPMWETMDFFKQLIAQHGGTEEAFAALAGSAGSHQFFTREEVARTILYLASDESSHLNGVEFVLAQGHVG